jgi:hypothetical protein
LGVSRAKRGQQEDQWEFHAEPNPSLEHRSKQVRNGGGRRSHKRPTSNTQRPTSNIAGRHSEFL